MVGADEHGDVLAAGAADQRAAHRGPGREQPVRRGAQRGADLVAGGR